MSLEIKSEFLLDFLALDEIANMVSPVFSPSNFTENSPRESLGYGSVDSDEYIQVPDNVCSGGYNLSPSDQKTFDQNLFGQIPEVDYQPFQSQQVFFPPNFSPPADYQYYPPSESWNSGLQDYIQAAYVEPTHQIAPLCPVGKSSLKQRRASRSKCPCIKCCHARVNCIPSPSYHACMVEHCNKTYTRPAHLRAHLKSHEQDKSPKCEICKETIMSAELFTTHMFNHGKAMRL
jgi:hypothetical protein